MKKVTLCSSSDYLTIECSANSQYLLFSWQGSVSIEAFIEGLWSSLEAIREAKVTGCILDLRSVSTMSHDQESYISEFFVHEMLRAGVRKAIVVVSNNDYNWLILKNIMRDYEGFSIDYCQSLVRAVRCIKEDAMEHCCDGKA